MSQNEIKMYIHSVNIGQKRLVDWRGKKVATGIFKASVERPIYLGFEDVEGDDVVDRKYHGGIDKACYAYSKEAYSFWEELYPDKTFKAGFFGENITVVGLNESTLKIGTQFEVGTAIIEVSQPRQPCFKLGIRFGSQKILKPFIHAPHPGVYFRVIQAGKVQVGDQLKALCVHDTEPTVLEVYKLIYKLTNAKDIHHKAINSNYLAASAMKSI